MSLSNIAGASLTSSYKIDQILSTYSGSLTIVGTGSLFTFNKYPLASNPVGEMCFIRGIISFDNGVSWQSANWFGKIPVGAGQDAALAPVTSANTVAFQASNRGTNFNILYKVFLIAKPNQSPQNPPTTYPASGVVFSSKYNYQKIAFDIETAAGSFDHNLGYPPTVFVSSEDTINGELCTFSYFSNEAVEVDSTGVYITPGFESATNFFRVYYD